MRSFILRIPTLRLLAISFLGLLLCRLLEASGFGGAGRFDHSPIGRPLVIVFSIVWCGTLLVVFPLQVFCGRAARREIRDRFARGEFDPGRMSPVQRGVFLANCGSLPRWLYLPFVILAIVLGGLFGLLLVIGGIVFLWQRVFGG